MRREHSIRLSHGMLPFALAHGLAWVPLIAARTVLFSLCYWLAHLQFRADAYFIFMACLFLINGAACE